MLTCTAHAHMHACTHARIHARAHTHTHRMRQMELLSSAGLNSGAVVVEVGYDPWLGIEASAIFRHRHRDTTRRCGALSLGLNVIEMLDPVRLCA